MFGKRQPQQLRERLEQVEEKFRLNKISNEQKNREKVIIVTNYHYYYYFYAFLNDRIGFKFNLIIIIHDCFI